MRSGLCPKCGHATVYSGRDVPVKNSGGNMLPVDFKTHLPFDNYVCTTCGYVERYISDRAGLDKIAVSWPDAARSKRKR